MNLLVKKYVKPEDRLKANFDRAILRTEKFAALGGKTVMSDCDLVLGDSRMANRATVEMLLAEYGRKPHPGTEGRLVEICSGPSSERVLYTLLPDLREKPELAGEMLRRMAEISLQTVQLISRTPYGDYFAELTRLTRAVLTNRTRMSAHAVLTHLVIRPDATVHKSRYVDAKPAAPTMFQWGLSMTKTRPPEALMVDDQLEVIEAARMQGMQGCWVAWRQEAFRGFR